jgi:molybdate/tungstate transport system permease protein
VAGAVNAAVSRRTGLADSHGLLLLCWLAGGLLGGFIVLPLLALAITPSAASLAGAARSLDVWQAVGLSLEAAAFSTLMAGLAGVPLAYVLARTSFPGKGVVAAIVDLPLAVPHTVAGIALLLVLGRQGILGAPAAALLGLKFWGTLAGVVAAMLFVSVPYTVNAARIGFEGIDARLEMTARTLGLGPWHSWLLISFPLARRSIMTGLSLTYARSISEFGAVIILAYYPMTAPVQIYTLFVRFGLDQAAAAAVLLLAVSLALFILFRQLAFGGARHAVPTR